MDNNQESSDSTSLSSVPSFQMYNTASHEVEPLEPEEEGHLRFYSCGPTVYSHAHIGNFRSFLTADLILRTAEAIGWDTTYVTNITDVGHLTQDDLADTQGEDKMVKALRSEEGQSFVNIWELADHYLDAFKQDWRKLNLRQPTVRPRATQHIREQIVAVERLVENDHAYETEKGVYFHVPSFPEYGELSGNKELEDLEESSRETVADPDKKDPRDFALWKKDTDHLMLWHSPFGWGYPGWHIECSVMATTYLGDTFDLHTGGEDLIFPHHECEIAQAKGISGDPLANHWVHTRFLQVEGEKMSKSKGNFYTVRDLILSSAQGGKGINPLVLRYALLSGHYRKQLNFTFDQVDASAKAIDRYHRAWERAEEAVESDRKGADTIGEALGSLYQEMVEAMADDLNTPEALALGHEGTKQILGADQLNASDGAHALEWLEQVNDLLGIIYNEYTPADDSAHHDEQETLKQTVETLLAKRAEARKEADYETADAIRDQLEELGIEVMDTPDGTKWRKKIST